jgi:hypothetical protein
MSVYAKIGYESPGAPKKGLTVFDQRIFGIIAGVCADEASKIGEVEISIDDLKSRSRVHEIAMARQIFFNIVWREYSGRNISLKDIGRYMGRDHSTVLHSLRVHENYFQTRDELYMSLYTRCRLIYSEALNALSDGLPSEIDRLSKDIMVLELRRKELLDELRNKQDGK